MSQPPTRINDLPALPRDQDGPVFNEPWQAHAFALTVRLSEAGCFTWAEWVDTLSQEIVVAQSRGDADLGDTYYQHWLNALERLCAAKGLVDGAALHQRTAAWRQAYLHTPHGQPVVWSAALSNTPRPHDAESAPQ